jgi:hypothetical protein
VLFPLDKRWIYLETREKLLNEARPDLWDNLKDNEFLVAIPEPRQYSEIRPLLLSSAYDLHVHNRGSVGFPMTIAESHKALFSGIEENASPKANLSPSVWNSLKSLWGLSGGIFDAPAKDLIKQLARVCIAICHAPAYESEHKDSLAQDWAHIPIPRSYELFKEISEAGEKVSLLLDPLRDSSGTVAQLLGETSSRLAVVTRIDSRQVRTSEMVVRYSFYGSSKGGWKPRPVESGEDFRPCWGETTGNLFINDDVYFDNVPENVWRYELGGYPVLKKWLAYRDSGRRPDVALSLQESDHLRSMVQRLAALLVLHDQLNGLYEKACLDCLQRDELGLV